MRGSRTTAGEPRSGGHRRRGLGSIPPRPVERSGSWLRAGFAQGLGATLAWLLVHTVLQIGQLLVAVPAAVAIGILLDEYVFPRADAK